MPFRQRSTPNSGPQQRSATRGPKRRRGWVVGVVDYVDPDAETLGLRAHDGSRVGRTMVGETIDVDAGAAELVLPDADGDHSRSLRDVYPGNELEVRFADADADPLLATKISHRGPPHAGRGTAPPVALSSRERQGTATADSPDLHIDRGGLLFAAGL